MVPEPAQEAARDLVGAREDIRGDLMRARHRVSKLLLRQGAARQRFDSGTLQLTYNLALESVAEALDRRARADKAIRAIAYDSAYTPVVRTLECLRGVSTLTAFGRAVENRGLDPFHRVHDRRLPRTGSV
ncbi:hypothetical protein [Arthrobacter sp. NPDC057013]|uniref:hypothetical protein n=1 Tax=Arthrobacter sp. NPDC057013 TaxID=3345999 RepID=UPI00363AA567